MPVPGRKPLRPPHALALALRQACSTYGLPIRRMLGRPSARAVDLVRSGQLACSLRCVTSVTASSRSPSPGPIVLFELASDGRIVYAAGATEMLVGRSASQLIGNGLRRPCSARRARARSTRCWQPRSGGERIDDVDRGIVVSNRRAAGDGDDRLPSAGHERSYLRRLATSHRPCPRQAHIRSRPETGLLDTTPFIDSVSQHLVSPAAARDQSLSLIRSERTRRAATAARCDPLARELLQTIGNCLRAFSSGGDLAARIGPDGLGILHGAEVDLKKLEQQLLAVRP